MIYMIYICITLNIIYMIYMYHIKYNIAILSLKPKYSRYRGLYSTGEGKSRGET